jgi:BarA-like signal transduction histidine kinase
VAKRSLFWFGVAAFLVVIVLIVLGTAGSQSGGAALDSTNAAPTGTRAVAEVLRQQGVQVTATTTLSDTERAIGDPATTTLFLYDPNLYLSSAQLRKAVALADTVIIADASFDELRAVAPELAQAGYVAGPLDADCDLTAVRKAGTVSGDSSGYRVVGDAQGVTACLGSGDGVYSLVRLDSGLVILGATDALTNEHVIEKGNAALALGLLGEHPDLVWYLPSVNDQSVAGPQDLGSLTPPWVTPALALLILSFVAGAIWRGRRFGPLVVENLPVVVRASETMLGRARLYQKSSARLRALDALRIGSVGRLAGLCGLPRTASVDDVVASVASVTGQPLGGIRRVLLDAAPSTDAELVLLSDELLELERDVAVAVRP